MVVELKFNAPTV